MFFVKQLCTPKLWLIYRTLQLVFYSEIFLFSFLQILSFLEHLYLLYLGTSLFFQLVFFEGMLQYQRMFYLKFQYSFLYSEFNHQIVLLLRIRMFKMGWQFSLIDQNGWGENDKYSKYKQSFRQGKS